VQIEGRRKIIGNWKILEFETGKGLRTGPAFQKLDGLCGAVGQNKSGRGACPRRFEFDERGQAPLPDLF